MAKKNGVWIDVVDNLTANLEKYMDEIQKKIEKGLKDCAGEVMSRSVRLCPKETGELAARSFMTDVIYNDDHLPEIYVGYEQFGAKTGTENPESEGSFYAVPVHERTYAHHDNGQAKFLEDAMNGFAKEYLKAMKDYCEEGDK